MRTFWDQLAEEFDVSGVTLLPGAPRVVNMIIDTLQRNAMVPHLNSSHDISLDVGAGVGRWTSLLAEKSKLVISIDISRKLLEIAKLRAKRQNVDSIVATATDLPLRSMSVDFLLSCTTLQHIVEDIEYEKAMEEICRVTRRKIVLLELTSRKGAVKYKHYPTIIRSKSNYVASLSQKGFAVSHECGVDFLPFYSLVERIREFLFARLKTDTTFLLERTWRTKSLRNVYYGIALLAILISLPLNILLCNSNLTRHTLLVTEQSSICVRG